MTIISKVGRGKFRYTLHSEDLFGYDYDVVFEKSGGVYVEGIVASYEPVEVYNTFDPIMKFMDWKIDEGDVMFGYDNFRRFSSVGANLIGLIHGFLVINSGIDTLGIRKLAEFIRRDYVNLGKISNDTLVGLINEAKEMDSLDYVKRNHPEKMRSRHVFYPAGVDLTPEQKKSITLSEIYRMGRKDKLRLIDKGINYLGEYDAYTKINNSRLSRFTDFSCGAIKNTLSLRQKKRIKAMNVNRFFNQEKVSAKFEEYINNYDVYSSLPVRKVLGGLGISQEYYYRFNEIIESVR